MLPATVVLAMLAGAAVTLKGCGGGGAKPASGSGSSDVTVFRYPGERCVGAPKRLYFPGGSCSPVTQTDATGTSIIGYSSGQCSNVQPGQNYNLCTDSSCTNCRSRSAPSAVGQCLSVDNDGATYAVCGNVASSPLPYRDDVTVFLYSSESCSRTATYDRVYYQGGSCSPVTVGGATYYTSFSCTVRLNGYDYVWCTDSFCQNCVTKTATSASMNRCVGYDGTTAVSMCGNVTSSPYSLQEGNSLKDVDSQLMAEEDTNITVV